jgi:hypothetical protein
LYIVCISLIKISVLLLYLRVFPSWKFTQVARWTLGFTVCYGIAFTLTQIFLCDPISHLWNGWDGEHEGRCHSSAGLAWSHAIINIVLDIVVLAMPIPTLLTLSISWRKKLGLCLMFCLGIV